ncbi:hypothetical protein N7G274_006498 [Stereocaulon virgatum]|uniref:Uncharacterized protein n=1 Tax=Stereocaulon virgatum TaxID=373712 RepID=A0ABR4A6Y6_9LECA
MIRSFSCFHRHFSITSQPCFSAHKLVKAVAVITFSRVTRHPSHTLPLRVYHKKQNILVTDNWERPKMPEMITKASPAVPTSPFEPLNLMNPPTKMSTSRPIGLLRLVVLTLCMTFLIIFLIYLVATAVSAAYDSRYGATAINNGRKFGRKGKPPPLDPARDLEAQPRTERPHMTFGYDDTPTSSLGSWGSHTPAAVASGIDLENLTSPMRLRQMVPRMGVRVVEEACPLGLSQYFFDDGVGIKRYESRGEEMQWKRD